MRLSQFFRVCCYSLLCFAFAQSAYVVAQNESSTTNVAPALLVEKLESDEQVEPRHKLQIEIEQYWAALDKTRTDVTYLKEQIANDSGDTASLFLRLTQRQMDMVDRLTDLTNNVVKQQTAQLNTDAATAELRKLMLPLGPRARRNMDEHVKSLGKNSFKSSALSDESVLKLSEMNYYSDILYQAISTHNANLVKLNFNNDETEAYLKESLYTRAETLSGQTQITVSERDRAQANLSVDKENADLKADLRLVQKKLSIVTSSLRTTIRLMDESNIESSTYRQLLIRVTGELTTDILKPKIFIGLVTNWLDRALIFTTRYSSEILFKLVIFSFLVLAAYYLSKLAGKITRKAIDRSKGSVSKLMGDMLVAITSRSVLIIGILMAISQMGVSLAPVLAGIGVIGFIIGFALQDTLSNFASGIMILVYRPYDVGDFIETGAVKGNVNSMNLVSTTVLTIDHQTLIIPNNKIWGDVINNITAQKVRRVDMTFGVGYNQDIVRIENILADIIENHPSTLSEPECLVKVHELGEYSVNFIVRPWVKTEDYWPVYWDITRAVIDRFDQEGIKIPFPQRDVNLYQNREKGLG
ncbi:MAG: small conductance mechanosensitive channel [Pseudomonadales bacterium]|jgi:small conductance mechanosensitive channel